MNEKVKSSKQTVFLLEQCAMSKDITKCSKSSLSVLTQAQAHDRLLKVISCSKSSQKFDIRACQVATFVMDTMQLVLSQLENMLLQSIENWTMFSSGSTAQPIFFVISWILTANFFVFSRILAEFFGLRDNSANPNITRMFFPGICIFSACSLGVYEE